MYGEDADLLLGLAGSHEVDTAINLCENRVVSTHSDVLSRKKHRPALPNDDIAGLHDFAAEPLHSQSLRVAVAPVTGTAACFLVCYCICLLIREIKLKI